MEITEKYLRSLIKAFGLAEPERFDTAFQAFISSEDTINNVARIRLMQENMMKDWQLFARREEIKNTQIAFPNGFVGKPYHALFDLGKFGIDDIRKFEISGFGDSGLSYDAEQNAIIGVPSAQGDIRFTLRYALDQEADDAVLNSKDVTIIINHDPKSLWKDIPSDASGEFAKPDNDTHSTPFLGKTLMISSKRGRSHANKGSFRDDDFSFAELASGWGIVAVADGAGSANYSRKGSSIACLAVVDYFEQNFKAEESKLLEEAISIYATDDAILQKLTDIGFNHLTSAAIHAQNQLQHFSDATDIPLAELHTTLTFVLMKAFPNGHAFLSFGVGDCPAVLVAKDFSSVQPLNALDVGEYGGGTRFITMPDVLRTNPEARCNFAFTNDFPFCVLMTDGIFDPKFEVEANLAKPEKWREFFDDLDGKNEDNARVSLEKPSIEALSEWMDFWKSGNHDDRTLIILY